MTMLMTFLLAVLLGIIDDLTTGTLMVPEGADEQAVPANAIDWADSNSQEAIPPEAWATIGAPSVLSHQVCHFLWLHPIDQQAVHLDKLR